MFLVTRKYVRLLSALGRATATQPVKYNCITTYVIIKHSTQYEETEEICRLTLDILHFGINKTRENIHVMQLPKKSENHQAR